jgi:hypothetical protein
MPLYYYFYYFYRYYYYFYRYYYYYHTTTTTTTTPDVLCSAVRVCVRVKRSWSVFLIKKHLKKRKKTI